jgi:secondary thiamine-phosphate synthase enzyme
MASERSDGVEHTAERGVRTATGLVVWGERLEVATEERVQVLDVTARLAEAVVRSGVRQGLVHLGSLHTTLAVFVNEPQPALLEDVRRLVETLVPRGDGWRHDDPLVSDCDRRNADAHLRAILLGGSVALPVRDGRPVLGAFQAVLAVELDGPRERALHVQVVGCP